MQIHTPEGGIGRPPWDEAAAEARVSTARVGRTRNLKYIMVVSWKEAAFLKYLYCVKTIRPLKGLNILHTGN